MSSSLVVYNIVSSTLEIRKIEDRVMKSPTKIQKHDKPNSKRIL